MRGQLIAGLVLAAALDGCRAPEAIGHDGARLVTHTHQAMGAELRLEVWTADDGAAAAAAEVVFADVDRLESLMSTWKAGSEIVRLNDAAGRAPVAVSPEVLEALRAARQAGDWTGGAFDVTFGALAGVWKFDHDQDNRIPAPGEVAARLPFVDYRALQLDDEARTAYLSRAGMRAHLGGIGKGYAVDRAARTLRERGLRDFIIQFGGDLYVSGRRGDRPWRLGIQDPRGAPDEIFAALDLSDAAFSTSGDYERFFLRNGRRYHHILDPRTGVPATSSRSVTIVAASAVVADALSTGVFVMGPEGGLALVERLPDVEAVIVDARNRLLVSTGLRDRLDVLRLPTDAP